MHDWDVYGRQGVDLAAAVTSTGFSAVKKSTRIGFCLTRAIASAAAGLGATALDHTLFGGIPVARPFIPTAVATAISLAEQLALAPIFLGEYITSTSLIAAHSSINVLSTIIPASSEAAFSLTSFINLVKREWNEPAFGGNFPDKRYGVTHIARALVAWISLQGVTQEWQEKRWFKYIREIHVENAPEPSDSLRRKSRVRVTSDIIFPGNSGQIISADIGEAPPRSRSVIVRSGVALPSKHPMKHARPETTRMSNTEMKATLRRLSKMVLAGYGGASLLFFGISPMSPHMHPSSKTSSSSRTDKHAEEVQLANAIDASEQAAGEAPPLDLPPDVADTEYSWWDILLGKHDQEIFERFANQPVDAMVEKSRMEKARMKATAVIGVEHLMPRFWVLTDHGRAQIVLVLRGTMSINEIAVDLTCEPTEFEPAMTTTAAENGDEDTPLPGQFPFPTARRRTSSTASSIVPRYHVHSGMLRMAHAMGDVGRPVQLAVSEALHRCPGYELVLCGHSLGAGVAALLGLMWADPRTCRTVSSSALPVGRRVAVYCFAPPCLTDAALGVLASNLIVSFVYSHDVVSRLSLDSVRDIRNAAMWLCAAHDGPDGEDKVGHACVTKRAAMWKAGAGSVDDSNWFIAVRKTLEANMQMANMFPPGRVLWAMRDSDLHPLHRLAGSDKEKSGDKDKLRLFDVLDVEKTFSQIIFARDMLSAHMPHRYDRVLHDLL